MGIRERSPFDERLLSHHPAGKACFDTCLANSWQPRSGDVLRLVRLWDEVQQGKRSEWVYSPRMEFVRWLFENGRINEGFENS
ncbi:MAG: hypothetical protein US86_C0002G0039 [Candidatus Daviesbacteria bacterium GW2011_GWA2_38_24]|uniref:Uncharacterized protein n=1 Tax=Candidatus Daviesbacteria bacterium GW2011_GWA2_38_24 TaxID=1618422 RepID=A0A0G0JJ97_9BACT|nr:MAG: hypothetical protein US86_C0002G0039 [Candidatus Daviesbacteria bacterium GW2011_GWA2_38_24]KKQ80000.1 MAG: hypothetical protein UT01_C0022G0002 [Candidatus Daviesbacteria bacterium GW2011_GWA1_38_7]